MLGPRLAVTFFLIVFVLLASGCGMRRMMVPREVPSDVLELTEVVDDYVEAYEEQYQIAPRPEGDALAAAEAYLRIYQPGPLPRVFQTTYIYDRKGQRLARVFDEGYRTWLPISRISPHLLNAIIATEDATFYSNPGYDPRRVLGALVQNAEAGEVVSGASTITMQLARQLFFTPSQRFEQTLERKVYEALLAAELSSLFTKDEILEMYLNLVHFGQIAYGVEAASQLYFDKAAADLTLAEATLLAGIPQKPAEFDLLTNFDLVKQRQRVVLNLMVRHGYLTADEANAVYAQEVQLTSDATNPPILAPHFVQYVTQEMNNRLNGTDVRRAGMRIFTTLDLGMQSLAEDIVAEQVARLQPSFDLSNAALVALKPGTGEILAMVGSADFDDRSISGQVNVAVRQRQPGSAIKPILYATAIEDNMISPATVLWDLEARYKVSADEEYRPRNYDNEFHGPVTVRTALANSYNVPAVKLLDAVGVTRMLEQARAMGITSLNRDQNWYGLSLTLGGGEVTLLDLVTSFHTLANQGAYLPPHAILFTSGGEVTTSEPVSWPEPQQVLSAETAYVITDILSDNDARTPEFGAQSALLLSRPAAAKTGTTTDFRDNWTVGYTRYLVTGVWAGNSDGRPMRNASGVTGAAPIWNAFMEAVLADTELLTLLEARDEETEWEFQPPGGIEVRSMRCPGAVQCPDAEIFPSAWLEIDQNAVQSESVYSGTVKTLLVDRGGGSQPVGACSDGDGVMRQLLRLPTTIGGTRLVADPDDVDDVSDGATRSPQEIAERVREEQLAVLNWSRRTGNALYWGSCEDAEATARAVWGNSLRSVAVTSYMDMVAEQETDEDTTALVARVAPPPSAPPSSSYSLMGVAHDGNCGGTFVLGQVANLSGQPVPGVRVVYQDQLGNRQESRTSSNPADYGSFRFPIVSDAAHEIYLSLVDESGSPIGATATVPHNQGGITDQSCHYAIWRGVD